MDSNFRQLLGQFGLAVFVSDTNLASDNRLQFDGIDLRGDQNDNRGTILAGPQVQSINFFPLSDTIGGTSISYVDITADDINSAGGSLSVQVSDGSHSGGYLIQTAL